jgi:hypothetical protein
LDADASKQDKTNGDSKHGAVGSDCGDGLADVLALADPSGS